MSTLRIDNINSMDDQEGQVSSGSQTWLAALSRAIKDSFERFGDRF